MGFFVCFFSVPALYLSRFEHSRFYLKIQYMFKKICCRKFFSKSLLPVITEILKKKLKGWSCLLKQSDWWTTLAVREWSKRRDRIFFDRIMANLFRN